MICARCALCGSFSSLSTPARISSNTRLIGQHHAERAAHTRAALDLDLAAVLGNNMRADRQAQAGAVWLVGKERLEQVRADVVRNADAGVLDLVGDRGGGLADRGEARGLEDGCLGRAEALGQGALLRVQVG